MSNTPPLFVRSGIWYVDLRSYGGQKNTSLGLLEHTSPIEVGRAIERRIQELRVAASVASPELPGLERPGLRVHDLIDLYLDSRAEDHATKGGESYVRDYCEFVRDGLGHLAVEQLAGKLGTSALKAWRKLLWERGWQGRSVRNAMNMAMAILRWGQDDERELTGPLPRRPARFAPTGKPLAEPCNATMTEQDFRHFRAHCFDEALHWGSLSKIFRGDQAAVADYIARRQLHLSFAFYTGAHLADCNGLRGEQLSVDVGRYTRINTKSARVVEPVPLDMPEQLQIDCAAELSRRGILRFPPDELVTGSKPWRGPTRTTQAACKRLWPDGSRPGFTWQLARRSCVWEYTVRGWDAHEIAVILGHVDEKMIREVYRRCSQLGIIAPTRVPWSVASGPHGRPSGMAPVLEFRKGG